MDVIKWSLIIAVGVLVLRFVVALIRKFTSQKQITGIMVITFVLTAVSAGMAMYLAGSIKNTIDERALIGVREKAVIQNLGIIREAELVYQELYGNYTSSWDTLINFIKNGEYPIIQKTEEIITLAYGADSIILHVDTIGVIPAWERIFKANYTENAVDAGVVTSLKGKVGDQVVKSARAYSLRSSSSNAEFQRDYNNNGTISALEVNVGDQVVKGQNLISYWEYRFDPKVDLDRLAYVPGKENVMFDIFTAEIPMGSTGLLVDVIEVRNPSPFDSNRKESNEAKNLRPLRFGSKTDATTAGNWE